MCVLQCASQPVLGDFVAVAVPRNRVSKFLFSERKHSDLSVFFLRRDLFSHPLLGWAWPTSSLPESIGLQRQSTHVF